jgi:hypothetical protein
MSFERERRLPPRERTFGELFPWRNIRRALMLVLLILGIFMIKRSTGPFLARIGEMWGPPPSRRARRIEPPPPPDRADQGFRVHLAPMPMPIPTPVPASGAGAGAPPAGAANPSTMR